MIVVVDVHPDLLLLAAPEDHLHPAVGGDGLNLAVGHDPVHDPGGDGLSHAAAQVVDRAAALFPAGDGGVLLIEGVAVAVENLRVLHGQHIPEDAAPACGTGEGALAHQREGVQVLEALRLGDADPGQAGKAHGGDLAKGDIVVGVLDSVSVSEHQSAAP